jgi:hypothetical protein
MVGRKISNGLAQHVDVLPESEVEIKHEIVR